MKSLREQVDIFNLAVQLPPHLANALTAQLEHYAKLSVAATDFGRNVAALSTKGLLVHDEEDDIVPFAPTQRVAESWCDAAVVERVTRFVADIVR